MLRTGRVTHEDLRERDPEFIARVEAGDYHHPAVDPASV